MPGPTFRGDPYHVLDVRADASDATIKRRWRELAREHHPDNAAHDSAEAKRLTLRMARINAAYDLLRDPARRARYDTTARRDGTGEGPYRNGRRTPGSGSTRPNAADDARGGRPSGPPPPPPTRPVTGRFDATGQYHRRNTVTSEGRPNLRGQAPPSARQATGAGDGLRASQPTGPVHRRRSDHPPPIPTLAEAQGTVLEFGRFRGQTLAEVAAFEPTYIDWVARTITRDRDLVQCARVIQADLDERGVERQVRPPTPGWGRRREEAAPA